MTLARVVLVLVAGMFAAPPLAAQTLVFAGARVIPIVGESLDDAVLVVRDGTIAALGARGDVAIPAGATVHDVSGRVILPGLVDTHSHVGGGWAGDASAPIQPDARIYDSIDVRHSSIQKAQAGGITTGNVMPGSGHLLSGQTLYLKFGDGRTVDDLAIRRDDGSLAYGIKMANGTNPQDDPPFPGTRGKAAALVRQRFVDAIGYRDKLERAGDDPAKRPDRDLGLEVLLEVLSGDRVVHHHTHRHDDIMTVLRLREEFGFRVVLQHVSEGGKVASEIAAAGVPASVIMIDSPGGKLEARDWSLDTPAVLEGAGVAVALHTDDPVNDSRWFLRSAGLAVRGGMSRDGALAALTIEGARMLDLEHRVGSLEAGKDADLVVLSGDPLSAYTRVLQTWVEGRKVFDLEDEQDRLWAEGGYGASRPGGALDLCCFDGREGAR